MSDTVPTPGQCDDPTCPVLHADPQNPIHPPPDYRRPVPVPRAKEPLLAAIAAVKAVLEPLECRQPAYGAPGHAHCAACCMGTGYACSNMEEWEMVQAGEAFLRRAHRLLGLMEAPL